MVVDGAFGAHVPVFGELTSTDGQRWLDSLPGLVRSLEEEWDISTGQPYLRGTAAWTAPAVTADGDPAVLKVCWPHREARFEAEGLRLWDGAGAVGVLRSDDSRWAMLLERCVPGIPLDECGIPIGDAFERAAGVLRRLWSVAVPAGAPFERMGDVTRDWAAEVRERMARYQPPFDAGLVELGGTLLETLPEGGRTVVIHGDFNPGNVLASQREPFLAIDAKPMIGDAAYDPKPLLEQLGDPFDADDAAGVLRARYRLFADLVELPVERMLAWSVARSVESALWNVSEGRWRDAERNMHEARLLADVGDA